MRITPGRPADVAALDGLVIGGGADVTEPLADVLSNEPPEAAPDAPGRRRRRRWARLLTAPVHLLMLLVVVIRWLGSRPRHGVDPSRDRTELALLRAAHGRGLPVLGICRGAQLMSLASGGALVRGLDDLYEERVRLYTVLPRRVVRLEEGTVMSRVVGRSRLRVNALHRHAVAAVGEGFIVAARELAGVVQAVERATPVLWWGVQWHPEYLPQSRAQLRLLKHWVDACRSFRSDQ